MFGKAMFASALIIAALFLSGCFHTTRTMSKEKARVEYKELFAYQERFIREEPALERQLQEVQGRYPMVSLSYAIQRATIAELLEYAKPVCGEWASGSHAAVGSLWLCEIKRETAVQLSGCISTLNKCVARSSTYEEGAGCFSNFSNCWQNP